MHRPESREELLRLGNSVSLVGGELIDESYFQGLVCGEHFASGEGEFSLAVGNSRLHRRHEPLGRHNAQLRLVQANREFRQHDPVLAAQRQKATARWAVTLIQRN